ncbi:hypothetical protein HNQ08_002495 [Deinococcus humi]|uniref:Uncharacterized protein n=1 Tax=Deinococcus humi TaxID=662880 RepID=A0A7W8JUA6_9DEIO|nr:hypothetical protein [Deinococcus humi]
MSSQASGCFAATNQPGQTLLFFEGQDGMGVARMRHLSPQQHPLLAHCQRFSPSDHQDMSRRGPSDSLKPLHLRALLHQHTQVWGFPL